MYLIDTTEKYRCESDAEAKMALDQFKADGSYEVIKSTMAKKEKKAKGEVIDEWVVLTVTKHFTNEKEPEFETKITYENGYTSVWGGNSDED